MTERAFQESFEREDDARLLELHEERLEYVNGFKELLEIAHDVREEMGGGQVVSLAEKTVKSYAALWPNDLMIHITLPAEAQVLDHTGVVADTSRVFTADKYAGVDMGRDKFTNVPSGRSVLIPNVRSASFRYMPQSINGYANYE